MAFCEKPVAMVIPGSYGYQLSIVRKKRVEKRSHSAKSLLAAKPGLDEDSSRLTPNYAFYMLSVIIANLCDKSVPVLLRPPIRL